MNVSLIITTYNWPEALAAVLNSVKQQTQLPNEVIIADDGSGEPTRQLIADYQKDFPVPLIHSWQPDDGFRAAESRNRAISKAQSEYLVIIDGDIFLPSSFIADHVSNAKPNQFIQGGRVILNNSLSQDLMASSKLPSVWQSGVKNRHNAIHSRLLSSLLSKISNSDKSTRSCNMSFWKSDIEAINGFNNEFVGWGREDSEFVLRLLHSNLNRLYLKFSGVGFHLYHKENSRASLPENDELLEQTKQQRLTRCENGLQQIKEQD